MILPIIPLRGLVAFPSTSLQFDVKREISLKALNYSAENRTQILLLSQKNPTVEEINKGDLELVGTIAEIRHVVSLVGTTIRVLCEGKSRAKVVSITKTEPFYMAEVEVMPSEIKNEAECEAYYRELKRVSSEYIALNPRLNKEVKNLLSFSDNADEFSDMLAHTLPLKFKYDLLAEFDLATRLDKLISIVNGEIEILKMETRIQTRVKEKIDKSQKEFYLREQIKAIHEELGDSEEDIDELKQKIDNLNADESVKKHLTKEWKRMKTLNSMSPELSIIRTYLETATELPWGVFTEDNEDLKRAREVLDEDHYALEKLKDRIVEYLAVRVMTQKEQGNVLCLVGPPGVGKTSIAKSIARALGRKYVRMSLGGVHDEAEIRGHRKTYVGAMPGRIISGMKNAGTMNPVFVLDEIDKMSSDYKGDPSSAMLEVLDREQNNKFCDNYLEVPFDLSKVTFIATANSAEHIPQALFDRMELVEMTGYTEEEKVQIALRHLIPKQCELHGVKLDEIVFTEDGVKAVINGYTKESGVRNLERQIATLCRKVVTAHLSSDEKYDTINAVAVEKLLGAKKYRKATKKREDTVGMCTGLAWTAVGGETLNVEAILYDGKGELTLTGHLGDVMKESAQTAYSYIKSHAIELGVDHDLFNLKNLHIHVPEGAIPKDGPSAGITLATAILSAFSLKPVKGDVAMTGEITLLGKVLPIGGLKEKTLAAVREGIKTVIVPKDNKKDVDELPATVRKKLNFVFVSDVKEVFGRAF